MASHPDKAKSGMKPDCLHYCLPGPPDEYNLVLKRVLAGLRHPRP